MRAESDGPHTFKTDTITLLYDLSLGQMPDAFPGKERIQTMSDQLLKMQPFNYRDVVLDTGFWKAQADEAIRFYLAISDDSLLYRFREIAGFEAPGVPLQGWYGSGPSVNLGQFITAFCKLYTATGEERLREKALFLSEELMRCWDASERLIENRPYAFEKWLAMLMDLHEYLGVGKERVCGYMSRMLTAAEKNMDRTILRDGIQNENLTDTAMGEWYTMGEQLYRAYRFTGDERYRAFAEEWEYPFFWDRFLTGEPQYFGGRHAYSHVNTFSSVAQAYLVKQEQRYLDILKGAYDELTERHTFATGGYGPSETLFIDNPGYLGNSLEPLFVSKHEKNIEELMFSAFDGTRKIRDDAMAQCEVSCCTWAVFKLCGYLLRFTGEARYADWAERMLINSVGALPPVKPGGHILYYESYYQNGGYKSTFDRRMWPDTGVSFAWVCCTGTFPQDMAEYYNLLYYHDRTSLYAAQYLPSSVQWEKDGAKITLSNISEYPFEEKVSFSVHTDRNVRFSLKLRVPSWLKRPAVIRVNGARTDIQAEPNQWAEIDRDWKDGDLVTMDLPFDLYFKPVDAEHSDLMALFCGPVVLVTDEMVRLQGDREHPETWLHPVEGKWMTFTTDPGHVVPYGHLTRTFYPYFTVGEMEWYFMYNSVVPEVHIERVDQTNI